MKVIGVTGLPGSGKGFLFDKAQENGAIVVNMGDRIREVAAERGTDVGITARKLREEQGQYVVAKLTINKINELLEKGLTTKVKAIPDGIPDMSFWQQRYYYYSQFDKGIQMDEECWWSVTPEIIAEYIAKLCPKDSVIVEGFAGSGGNVIQFSNFCKKVYAIDINNDRLNICKNNYLYLLIQTLL